MTTSAEAKFDEHFYRRHYVSYELQNPPRKLRFYRQLLEDAAGRAPGLRILELGCAFGHLLATLDPSWRLSGLDASQFAIEDARRRVPNGSFATGSAERIPFEGPFDAIAAFDVLEHVPSLDEAAASIRAKLVPGGHLVFVVPVYDGPTGPVIRLLDRDETHIQRHSRGFWFDWAAGAGFRVRAWRGIYRYLLPGGHYVHWPTQRLRRFTPAVAIVARREQIFRESS